MVKIIKKILLNELSAYLQKEQKTENRTFIRNPKTGKEIEVTNLKRYLLRIISDKIDKKL
jgi:hypothetical protein